MVARRRLQTAEEVIDALGGVSKVAEITGCKYSAAFNWKAFGEFPPKTYVALTQALQAQGKSAPANLWGMVGTEAEAIR